MPHSKAEQAEIAERRAQLVRLRRIGVPFDDERILSLGYSSRSHATKDLVRALAERSQEQTAEVAVYRQQENERLDALLEAVWPRATQPHPIFDREGVQLGEEIDTKAIDTVLRLMDRRAKLNGYDMPVKAELTGADGGPLAVSTVDPDRVSALIAATSRLDIDAPANTATSTPGEEDDEERERDVP